MAHSSRKVLLVIGAVIAACLGVGGGAGATYALHYNNVALPGVSIGGQSVTGMSHDEMTTFVEQRLSDVSFTAVVNGKSQPVNLTELGITVDASATADAALINNGSFFGKIKALFSSQRVDPVISIDKKAASAYALSLAAEAGPPPVEGEVKLDSDGGRFVATEARKGKTVDGEALVETVKEHLAVFEGGTLDVRIVDVEPSISTEEAQKAAQAANELIGLGITVNDGIDNFSPSGEEKAQWVKIEPTADGSALSDPVFDEKKVQEWVKETAETTNVEAQPTINNVDASGNILVEARPGVKGLTVNNDKEVFDGIMQAVSKGESYEGSFHYDDVEPEVESRPALPGAENAVYPAAAGEKWLEINLGNNSVTAYEGLTAVRGPVLIVPGSPGHETVTGLFHIYMQFEKQDMGCTPEWPYCARDVPWVSYFHGSYAFHGAPWQDTFGWNGPGGSHGCINMPVDEAYWLHQWSELGTPVVSHY
ncbi:MAG: hypothetical protein CSA82_03845 [Actinobacteria bacterium]|nr:MAG: hypothetical protein CSA82_03845 [Actinomycetota bacterium]